MASERRGRHRRLVAGLTLAGALLVPTWGLAGAATPPAPGTAEDGERQTALVNAEDKRVAQLGTLASLTASRLQDFDTPFRFRVNNQYSLVLTPRANPYTVTDLLHLAPQTFTHEPDGSYLLSESIYLSKGAGLSFKVPGMVLHLESDPQQFVSIVSDGGFLELWGSPDKPMTIQSWDPGSASPDLTMADGRSYLRSIGGQVSIQNLRLTNLGFWSGRTGGLALNGSSRPPIGALNRAAAPAATSPAATHAAREQAAPDITAYATQALGGSYQGTGQSFATGDIGHLASEANAFGLFLSSADGVHISDSTFSHNLFDGLVMHRYVHAALVQRSVSRQNGGDGFRLARAVDGARLLQDTADGNAGAGFSIDGSPLSDGSSVSGLSPRSYGGSLLSGDVATHNVKDGFVVRGGVNTEVQRSSTIGNRTGIVVIGSATRILLSDNRIADPVKHGIAIEDGPAGVQLRGNTVTAARTAVYVRDASAAVVGNVFRGGTLHGISLIGKVDGSVISSNTISGHGGAALDTVRVTGHPVRLSANRTAAWSDLGLWRRRVNRLLSPIDIVWLVVLGSVFVMAVARGHRDGKPRRPYRELLRRDPAPTLIDLTTG